MIILLSVYVPGWGDFAMWVDGEEQYEGAGVMYSWATRTRTPAQCHACFRLDHKERIHTGFPIVSMCSHFIFGFRAHARL
jgi:hypothetical protein